MSYNSENPTPPKFALWFLRWFCTGLWLEEIEGDLEEEFILNIQEKGIKKARKTYIWTVLKSFRSYLIIDKLKPNNNFKNNNIMFSNYLKITMRALLKNKVYSFINISGLALGIAGALLILHYVTFESSYDQFQEDYEDIYRVSLEIHQNGEFVFHSAENYPATGLDMVNDYPEVIEWSHLYNMGSKNNVIITYEEGQGQPIRFKHRKFMYASPNFLSMFSAEMMEGDAATALSQPLSMVISESTAKKYFGNESAIGKKLRLRDDDFNNENCIITGVFKDLPAATHLKYDVLISTSTLYTRYDGALARYSTSWQRKDFYTYIKLLPGTDVESLTAKLPGLVDKYKPELKEQNTTNSLHLQPLNRIHLDSHLSDEAELNGDAQPVNFLSIIALFIVIIAWVNYINLATSRSLDRAREVGIRKVLGSLRIQLIRQFLFESVVINVLAIMLAIGFIAIALPSFYQISGIPKEVKIWDNQLIWMVLGGIFLIGSFVSGFYPAVVLSSFKPVSTLKGKFRDSGSGVLLRKGLVIFQFATSSALIIGTLTVNRQMNFIKSADLGFDPEQTIVVEQAGIADTLEGARSRQVVSFTQQLRDEAIVKKVAGSLSVPGKKIRFKGDVRGYTQPQGQTHTLSFLGGDIELISTLGLKIIAGRDFSMDFPRDLDTSVVVSRSAVRLMGFESPEDIINKSVTIETFNFTAIVVGVVEDYNHESLRLKPDPTIFLPNPSWAEYFLIRVNTEDASQALSMIEEKWEANFPGNPFDYFFLEEFFDNQYKSDRQFQSMFSIFSVMAIVIGCLGLFGLSAFTAMKKTKEIGIRKVLGASVPGLFYMLSKEFMVLIVVSNIIAWPLIYLAMQSWLEGFQYRTNIDFLIFGLALVAVVLIALVTISFQMIKSAKLNPVDSLRYE
jgi:putative ABC transport system permease protein